MGLDLVAGGHGGGTQAFPLGNQAIRTGNQEAACGGEAHSAAVLR